MTKVGAFPAGEMVTDRQVEEHVNRFAKTIHELSMDEYNALRGDEDYKNLARQLDGKIQRIVNRRFPLGASLPLDSLNGLRTVKANIGLWYDWSARLEEEARYELIKAYFRTHLGINNFDLIETGPQNVPHWLQMLIISPVDLAAQRGIDISESNKQYADAYCELTQNMVVGVPGLQKTDYVQNGCLGNNGARLNNHAYKQWGLSNTQQKGKPLFVRRMWTNLSTWFNFDGVQYSVASEYVRAVANRLPIGSQVKKAACGDLIVLVSVAVGEPHILDQIALGTCPRIGVPGTELRYGQRWLCCPCCFQREDEAWLGGVHSVRASDNFGSLLCAVE